MIQKSLAVIGVLLMAAACGSSSSHVASGPTPSSVAVQPGDVPSGMVRCDLSGDIDSYLAKEKTQDPTTYSSVTTEWGDAKKNGATAAYTVFYTDSTAHCAAMKTNTTDIGTANYKLIVNFVIQFKDEASATKGYTSESIFGFSSSELKAGAGTVPISEGPATGLGPNSIALDASVGGASYYIAVWQKKVFMVILAVLNVDSTASKKVATSENSRIS